MKVQCCPSCSARYRVERLEPGDTFECRRCQALVTVEGAEPTGRGYVSLGLLTAGLLVLAGLLLEANPSFGHIAAWPWEHVQAAVPLASKGHLVLWALLGLWALLTALLPAMRSRSVLTLALASFALLIASESTLYGLQLDEARPFLFVLAASALAAGLALLLRRRGGLATTALLLGGGLVLLGLQASGFEIPQMSRLAALEHSVRSAILGTLPAEMSTPDRVWGGYAAEAAVLLAALLGLVAALGLRARWLAMVAGLLLLAGMLLPAAAGIGMELQSGFTWPRLGQALVDGADQALVESGVALWLVLALAAADLVRTRGDLS
ncbi:MAG: hypothetical protein ACC662_05250 [Planctomycetota bacterium]